MANILISPLGTGSIDHVNDRYKSTDYCFSDKGKRDKSSFVTSVITQNVKKFDKVFLIGTNKSMWDAVYEFYSHKVHAFNPEIFTEYSENRDLSDNRESLEWNFIPINKALDAYLKKIEPSAEGGSEVFLIHYGYNHKELTDNIDILMAIADRLKDGDQVYLDITHSFRSIPFFILALINYIQTLKNVRLKTMYYGMLDAIRELGYAPIVDLKQIVDMNKWSDAVNSFIRYGDGYELADIIKPLDLHFSNSLKKMSDALCFNFIGHFKSQIPSLINGSEKIKNHPIFRYFKPQFDEFISIFNMEDPIIISINTAEWLMNHRRYGLALLCTKEAALQLFYKTYQKNSNEENSKIVSVFLKYHKNYFQNIPDGIWKTLISNVYVINRYRISTAHPDSHSRLSMEEIKAICMDTLFMIRKASSTEQQKVLKDKFSWVLLKEINKNNNRGRSK